MASSTHKDQEIFDAVFSLMHKRKNIVHKDRGILNPSSLAGWLARW
jgi:hypothetical protein